MKLHRVFSFCLILASPLAAANDSSAGLDSGNIVFKKSDGIAMRAEDLYISPEAVQVRYEFENTTAADIKTLVGFPIPPFPVESESDRSFDPQSSNPLRFWLRVDGKQLPVKVERKVKGGEVHLIYHWEQVFPAGKTLVVEHRYAPSAEASILSGSLDPQTRKTYCVDADMAQSVAAGLGTKVGQTAEIGYILTTANNWKGPIGRFRLVLDKLRPETLVSLCATGLRKISPTQFEMVKKDFVPQKDLAVLFVFLPER